MSHPVLGMDATGGVFPLIPPNASSEQQIAAINLILSALNDQLRTQVFQDTTAKRMLIGYQKDGWGPGKDFGIKVSIAGVDVTQATDSELLFKMDLATWYWYDPATHKNHTQIGILPDGSGGFVVAKADSNVADAYP